MSSTVTKSGELAKQTGVCHCLSVAVTACLLLSLSVNISHYLLLSVAVSHHFLLSLSVAVFHYFLLSLSVRRPLVVQMAGDDPAIMLAAAKLVEHQCDAFDINLGCPQRIAYTGANAFLAISLSPTLSHRQFKISRFAHADSL